MAVLGHRRRVETAVFCASFAAMLSLPYIVSGKPTKQGQVPVQWMKTLTEHPCVLIGCLHIGPDINIQISGSPRNRLGWRHIIPFLQTQLAAAIQQC